MKKLLGRSDPFRQEDNVARERLNALIRREYGGRHLFDLAAIESTKPDDTRVSGHYENQEYFALYDGYASDRLRLNAVGFHGRGNSLSRGDSRGVPQVDATSPRGPRTYAPFSSAGV